MKPTSPLSWIGCFVIALASCSDSDSADKHGGSISNGQASCEALWRSAKRNDCVCEEGRSISCTATEQACSASACSAERDAMMRCFDQAHVTVLCDYSDMPDACGPLLNKWAKCVMNDIATQHQGNGRIICEKVLSLCTDDLDSDTNEYLKHCSVEKCSTQRDKAINCLIGEPSRQYACENWDCEEEDDDLDQCLGISNEH